MRQVNTTLATLNAARAAEGLEAWLDSADVGKRLQISPQTVRILSKGIRGSKHIEPLPSTKVVVGEKGRVLFLLSEVLAWRHRVNFSSRKGVGRRPAICQHCGKPMSKRSRHVEA